MYFTDRGIEELVKRRGPALPGYYTSYPARQGEARRMDHAVSVTVLAAPGDEVAAGQGLLVADPL